MTDIFAWRPLGRERVSVAVPVDAGQIECEICPTINTQGMIYLGTARVAGLSRALKVRASDMPTLVAYIQGRRARMDITFTG